MDFSKSESHSSVEELAQTILRDQITDDYHKAHRESADDFDSKVWKTLADAGLLGATIGEEFGGSAMDFLVASAIFEAQGAVLAKLPLWQSIVAAQTIERFASAEHQALLPALVAGEIHLAMALAEASRVELAELLTIKGGSLSGCVNDVAFAKGAAVVLLPVQGEHGIGLYLLDVSDSAVTMELQLASNEEAHYQLHIKNLSVDTSRIITAPDGVCGGNIVEWLLQRSYTAIAAVQLGVVEEAIKRTAIYVSERHQFNKPLASFQAVSHRAADGYIDYSALRACVWSAAWRLSENKDATTEARTAKWWACEAGHRIGHTAQHLHGGMGSDIDYPIHRFFLWAKQLEYTLGGAQEQLAQLGRQLAQNDQLGIVV